MPLLLLACTETSGVAGPAADPRLAAEGEDTALPGDDIGGAADDETDGPRPAEVEAYEALFDGAHLVEVGIALDAAAEDELRIDPAGWARVAITVDGVALADVGARMREGDTTAGRPGWRFKLDEFGQARDLGWMERFELDPMDGDPAMMRRVLEATLARDLGVPAPRASFARVSVGGEYRGLYAFVEGVDARFTTRRWAPGGGDTWEGEDGADFTDAGLSAFESVSGRADLDALVAVAHRVRAPGGDFFQALDGIVDMEGFLAAWAFLLVTGDRAVYPFDRDRFYVYFDPADGRARIVPRLSGEAWPPSGLGRWEDVLGTLAEQCYFYDDTCGSRLLESARAAADATASAELGAAVDRLSALSEDAMDADPTRPYSPTDVQAARAELRASAEALPAEAAAALEGAL